MEALFLNKKITFDLFVRINSAIDQVLSWLQSSGQSSRKSAIHMLCQLTNAPFPDASYIYRGNNNVKAILTLFGVVFGSKSCPSKSAAETEVYDYAFAKIMTHWSHYRVQVTLLLDTLTPMCDANQQDELMDSSSSAVKKYRTDPSLVSALLTACREAGLTVDDFVEDLTTKGIERNPGPSVAEVLSVAYDEYVADLTQQGIEPNPGPKGQRAKRTQPKRTRSSKKKTQSVKRRVKKEVKREIKREDRDTKLSKRGVVMTTIKTLAPAAVTYLHNYSFGDYPTARALLEDVVNAIVVAAFNNNPPPPSEIGVSGDLTPVMVKAYLMQAVMTALREVGSLGTSDLSGDVYSFFPDFGEENPVPIALLNYLAYYMPYSEGSGELKTTFQHLFRVTPSYFSGQTRPGLDPTHPTGISRTGAFSMSALAQVGTGNYVEYNQNWGVATDATVAKIWGLPYDVREKIANYVSGVYPCAAFSKRAKHAPDASSYATVRSIDSSSALVATCASSNVTPGVVEICGSPNLAVKYTAGATNVISLNGMYAENIALQSTAAYDNACMGYAQCGLDMYRLGSIPAAIASSKWKGIKTFVPSLLALSTTSFHQMLWAVIDKLNLSASDAMALAVVAESKFQIALRRSNAFVLPNLHFDVFGEEPLPPIFLPYFASLGPVVCGDRVAYLCPGFISSGTSATNNANWLSRLCTNTTLTNVGSTSYWSSMVQWVPGMVIGGCAFNAVNFPSATFTQTVLTPVLRAKDILLQYQRLAAYSNFLPVSQSPMGGPETFYQIQVGEAAPAFPITSSSSGLLLGVVISIQSIWSTIIGSSSDAMRAALFALRTFTQSANFEQTMLNRFVISGINIVDAARALAEWGTSGPGYTYVTQVIAEAAQSRRQDGVSVAGITTPATGEEVEFEHVLKSLTNEFSSSMSNKLRGALDHKIHDVVNVAENTKKSNSFVDFMPKLAKNFGRKVGKRVMENTLTRYEKNPEMILNLGKGALNLLFGGN